MTVVFLTGVPRARRGEIWKLLARQYNLSNKGFHSEAEERPEKMGEYHELLQGLTPHQHAILIDLGLYYALGSQAISVCFVLMVSL